MGRGAEEERKTEVSKQKVEAKRQAQVKEVKEGKGIAGISSAQMHLKNSEQATGQATSD